MMITTMNATEIQMIEPEDNELSPVLKLIMQDLSEEFEITDAEYEKWREWYDTLKEHEKLERLLGAISQYLTSPSKGSAVVMASAITCTHRYIEEKSEKDF
jgi:hypothetical protein